MASMVDYALLLSRLQAMAGTTQIGLGGDDVMSGKFGNDHLFGNGGNDFLMGNGGNDSLDGGSGNDHLAGGSGNDALFGGSGDDILSGGTGNDFLVGGDGRDTFSFFAGGGHDTIQDFNGLAGDRLNLMNTAHDFTSVQDLINHTHNIGSTPGSGVEIDLGGGDSVTLEHVSIDQVVYYADI